MTNYMYDVPNVQVSLNKSGMRQVTKRMLHSTATAGSKKFDDVLLQLDILHINTQQYMPEKIMPKPRTERGEKTIFAIINSL
jgi:hypothetical protein